MEAKDTVMSDTLIQVWVLEFVQPGELDLNAKLKEFAQAQAEISFKAGQDELANELVLARAEIDSLGSVLLELQQDCINSRKAGIREVVEWGIEICHEHLPKWKGKVDLMGGVLSRRECPKCWQAKLKE